MIDETALHRMQTNLETFELRARDFTAALQTFRHRRRSVPVPLTAPRPSLTSREIAILRMIADGKDNGEIAETLHFAVGTIKLHVREILDKLQVSGRTEAAVHAVRLRLI